MKALIGMLLTVALAGGISSNADAQCKMSKRAVKHATRHHKSVPVATTFTGSNGMYCVCQQATAGKMHTGSYAGHRKTKMHSSMGMDTVKGSSWSGRRARNINMSDGNYSGTGFQNNSSSSSDRDNRFNRPGVRDERGYNSSYYNGTDTMYNRSWNGNRINGGVNTGADTSLNRINNNGTMDNGINRRNNFNDNGFDRDINHGTLDNGTRNNSNLNSNGTMNNGTMNNGTMNNGTMNNGMQNSTTDPLRR